MSFRTIHSRPETAELTRHILRAIESWADEKDLSTTFIEFSTVQLAAEKLAEAAWVDAVNCTKAAC